MIHSPSELLSQLTRQRWFAAKDQRVRGVALRDRGAIPLEHGEAMVDLIEIDLDRRRETYVLVRYHEAEIDALGDPHVAQGLLRHFQQESELPTQHGVLRFHRTHVLHDIPASATEPARLLTAEQSNTSIQFGNSLILKLLRRVQPGVNPDLEVPLFLTERTGFRDTALVAGWIDYHPRDSEPTVLSILQTFVPNVGDAWETMLRRLDHVMSGEDPDSALGPIAALGDLTGRLHVALASVQDVPAFAPRTIEAMDVDGWIVAASGQVRQATTLLRKRGIAIDEPALLRRARDLAPLVGTLAIRHHGDYHLGQVLERTDGGFAVIDFEGEPLKPLPLRRERQSPLRDVAGMLRSLDYARNASIRARRNPTPVEHQRVEQWYGRARSSYVNTYLQTVRSATPGLLPTTAEGIARVLAAFELDKAVYEVQYELSNRPDWLPIPLAALQAEPESGAVGAPGE